MLYHPRASAYSERLVLVPKGISDAGGGGRWASTPGWAVLLAGHTHFLQEDSSND